MGQIIIDIPVEENLRFEVNNTKEYKELKKYLNSICTLENSSASEDAYDLACVKKARKEYKRTGELIDWEDIKVAIGL